MTGRIRAGLILFIIFSLAVPAANAQQDSWKTELDKRPGAFGKLVWILEAAKDPAYASEILPMLEAAIPLATELGIDSLTAQVYNSLGMFDRRNGDPENAWLDFQTAKIYYIKCGNYNEVAKLIYNQSQILILQNLPDSCIRFLNRSKLLISLSTDEKMKLYLRSIYPMADIKRGKKEQAQAEFHRLLPIAQEMRDTQMIISTYINIGMLEEEFDSALYWYDKGMRYAKGKSPSKYVELLVKIGFLYANRDDEARDSALYYYLEAEKHVNDLPGTVYKFNLYNSLGDYFYSRGEFGVALSYFHLGFNMSKGLSPNLQNLITNNLALTYCHLSRLDSATYYLDILGKGITKTNADYDKMLYYQTKSVFERSSGDSCNDRTIMYTIQALEYAAKIGETRIGTTLIHAATRCLLTRPLTPSNTKLAKAMIAHCAFFHEELINTGNKAWLSEVLNDYARLEARFGDPQKALALYQELTDLLSDMNQQTYFKGMDEALVKYKSNIKDSKIALLTEQEKAAKVEQRLTILVLTAVLLICLLIFVFYTREHKTRKLLDERNRKVEQLLREVHHRVKNNLQIVSSFINIQLDKTNDAVSRQALLDTSARIMALAGLHQSLYRQDDLSHIQLDQYIRELCVAIGNNTRQGIQIECDLEELTLDIDQAIPIGLAVNELITNSVKHAFGPTNNGMIRVKLSHPKNWELVVSDNGKGLPADLNTAGLTSIGMRLVQDITETQLKGSFQYYNDNGAVFKVIFLPQAA